MAQNTKDVLSYGERRPKGVFVSRWVVLTAAVLNVFLLVSCVLLLVQQWGTSVEYGNRDVRQFGGAATDRHPGERDPSYTEGGGRTDDNILQADCCRLVNFNTLRMICTEAGLIPTVGSTAPIDTSTAQNQDSLSTSRLKRMTPVPTTNPTSGLPTSPLTTTRTTPTTSTPTTPTTRTTPTTSTSTPATTPTKATSATTLSTPTTTNLAAPSTSGPKTTTTLRTTTKESDEAFDRLRLPRRLRPYHYDIWWRPDFYHSSVYDFSLNGSVQIYFRCHSPTDTISVNFRRLTIDRSSIKVTRVQGNAVIAVTAVNEDARTEVYNITLGGPLAVGDEIVVAMRFTGYIESATNGVYWSQYTTGNTSRFVVSTQMETTEARRAFPCVDDPSAKATFTLSIDRQTQVQTMANTPLNFTLTYPWTTVWVTDVFETTKPMSTYLLAFVISDFTSVNTNIFNGIVQVPVRLWAQDSYRVAGYLDYSRLVAPIALNYFQEYFNYSFNWPKLDMVATPKLTFGGMENWGLITYQINRILFNREMSDSEDKQAVTGTVSHEILHNWLGNTVTIDWWSDLWLAEGFARHFQYVATQQVQPTWDADQLFVDQIFYTGAMWNDDSGDAAPVYNTRLYTNSDLDNMFSSSTYDKGGCVVRMLSKLIVGEDVFRKALQRYVVDHQYGNVNHWDLFEAMNQAYLDSGLPVDFDVYGVMSTWILQSGFPLVTARTTYSTGQLTLTQKLYLYQPDTIPSNYYPSPYGYLWEIPVTYITNYNQIPVKVWMHKTNETIAQLVQPLSANDWILINVNLYGYYRVNYEESNWKSLASQLKTDHTKIPVNNRAQLIEDSFTLSMSGNLSQLIGLTLTEYLTSETEYLPWKLFNENFAPVIRRFSTDDQFYRRLQNYVLSRVQKNYDVLGSYAKPGDNISTIYLRRIILELACGADSYQCLNDAIGRFQSWRSTGFNNTALDPDLRYVTYCAVAANGSYGDWQVLASRYLATLTDFSGESGKLIEAMTCTRNMTTIRRLLGAVQAMNYSLVGPSDLYNIVWYIARSKYGYSAAWDHLYNFGNRTIGRVDILRAFSSVISTTAELQRFDSYVSRYGATNDYERSSFESTREKIQQNIAWRLHSQPLINDWLVSLGF